MQQRLVIRYSMSFKRQVVSELESGRFDSIVQASEHYGITGSMTVRKWLGKFGRNHLCPKVIRVEKPDEQNQVRQLKNRSNNSKRPWGRLRQRMLSTRNSSRSPARKWARMSMLSKKKSIPSGSRRKGTIRHQCDSAL
jgi:transposase-like protein